MSQASNLTPHVLRAKDAATFLGIGQSTLWRWAQEGRLPRGKRLSGKATVWRVSDLRAFIEQQDTEQDISP